METKKSVNIFHLIILDESGSMSSIYNESLSAMNETITSIRNLQNTYPEQHHFVSIITFEGTGETAIKVRRDRVAIEKVEEFTEKDYCPGSYTPLYDAMGYSINHLDKNISDKDAVMVTIITDGMENASQYYSGKQIKTLVSRQRKKGWTFAYIGANQDAIEVANEINISNAINFEATTEGIENMNIRLNSARNRFADEICKCECASISVENLFDEENDEA